MPSITLLNTERKEQKSINSLEIYKAIDEILKVLSVKYLPLQDIISHKRNDFFLIARILEEENLAHPFIFADPLSLWQITPTGLLIFENGGYNKFLATKESAFLEEKRRRKNEEMNWIVTTKAAKDAKKYAITAIIISIFIPFILWVLTRFF